MLHLRVITPKKITLEEDVESVTAPGADGEMTILSRHMNLFSMLTEGIVTIRKGKEEQELAIGAGYLETDGKDLNILVARAYGQGEVDQHLTEKAIQEAKSILARSKDQKERLDATMLLRRSTVDLKLLRKRKRV